MPDHFHGLLRLGDGALAAWAPADRRAAGPAPDSLGAVIGQFKSTASRQIMEAFPDIGIPIWQRGYHDQIVRTESRWRAYQKYTADNPIEWWKRYGGGDKTGGAIP